MQDNHTLTNEEAIAMLRRQTEIPQLFSRGDRNVDVADALSKILSQKTQELIP